jgi:hypothetical protein
MSRGRKLLVAGLAALALTCSPQGEHSTRAQESSNPSLSERFTALGSVFKRKKTPSQSAASKSTNSQNRSSANSSTRSGSSSRSGIADFLHNGLFGRNKSKTAGSPGQAQNGGQDYLPPEPPPFIVEAPPQSPIQSQARANVPPEAKVAPPATVDAPAGSAQPSPQARTHARKSPSTTRQEDLDATLSDLLANEAIISSAADEGVQAIAADTSAPAASPPPAEEPVVVAPRAKAKASRKVAKQREVSTDLNEALAAAAADTHSSEKKERARPADRAVAAAPAASGRLDVHDALLSDDLYDDLIVEEEEAAQQAAENSSESDEFGPPARRTAPLASHPKHLRALPDPRAEERVAEVTRLPFESMGEPAAQPEPPLQSTQPELLVPPEQQRKTVVHREPVRSPSTPVAMTRRPQGDVLMSTEQPVIVSHVEGPRSILVGREASYRVVLENTSHIDAQNLTAAIQVPEWADLVDVASTQGEVACTGDDDSNGLEWRLPELSAHSSQTLRLRLIPRSGREFQLGVQWTQESASTEARVVVQEPKLEMSIHGPQEVLYGTPQRFRLTLYNPGTGPAERVAVSLIPPGNNPSSASTHVIGTLGPEEVKEIEMELTARDAGELILQASATATGGLQADAVKRVLCRKPDLEVDWRGPDQTYAGTETAYYFRVRNTGSASTDPVEVKVRLPEGIQFLSASDSYSVDSQMGVVTWRLPSLAAGEERFVQVGCRLDRPGAQGFDVTARTVSGDLVDTKSVHTEVVALADLKLAVNDPQGAQPVGETVVYEIRVQNRGTSEARGVAIVGLFSEGIEPVAVEGAQSSVRDGRVSIQPVKSLPGGGEVLLRIRAVASRPGTHVFRVEVACQDLDLKLAAEETTRFFQDEFHWKEGQTPYMAERSKGTISR